MRNYVVELSAKAFMSASIEVTASNAEVAAEIALQLAQNGDVAWVYDGTEDETAQVERVDYE